MSQQVAALPPDADWALLRSIGGSWASVSSAALGVRPAVVGVLPLLGMRG